MTALSMDRMKDLLCGQMRFRRLSLGLTGWWAQTHELTNDVSVQLRNGSQNGKDHLSDRCRSVNGFAQADKVHSLRHRTLSSFVLSNGPAPLIIGRAERRRLHACYS